MRLPCLDCELDCEAKLWLARAKALSEAGLRINMISLPCPKNGVTYKVGPVEPKETG